MLINRIKQWFKKPVEPTHLEMVQKQIKYLKKQTFNNVYSSNLALYKLTVVKKSVIEYTGYIRLLTNYLSAERELLPRNIEQNHYQMSLPNWFVVNGMFITPTEHVVSLLDEIEVFIVLYNKYDNMIIKNYNQENNLRLVGKAYGDILNLLKELTNVSDESIHTGSKQADTDR
jgi:hypothetical protein